MKIKDWLLKFLHIQNQINISRDEIADNIDRFIKNKNRTPEEDEEFTKIYNDYIKSMDDRY
jgi:hypothetical protein